MRKGKSRLQPARKGSVRVLIRTRQFACNRKGEEGRVLRIGSARVTGGLGAGRLVGLGQVPREHAQLLLVRVCQNDADAGLCVNGNNHASLPRSSPVHHFDMVPALRPSPSQFHFGDPLPLSSLSFFSPRGRNLFFPRCAHVFSGTPEVLGAASN